LIYDSGHKFSGKENIFFTKPAQIKHFSKHSPNRCCFFTLKTRK